MRTYLYGLMVILFSVFSLHLTASENVISAGTTIKARMAESINSRVRPAGYRFKVLVDSDIKVSDKVIIKSGSQAQAIIQKIRNSGKGQAAPDIVVTLTSINVNNRRVNVSTFPIAGKGTTSERKAVGEVDENEYTVFDNQGKKISASIPVVTKDYNLILTEGTALYFILKEPIAF